MNENISYRVLIVEDQALIAMLVEDMLKECGCQVVGPVSKLHEAWALISRDTIDVGLLDINLGGETVYPVADAMQELKIPFIFSTAYSADVVPARFRTATVLQNPFPRKICRRLCEKASRELHTANQG